VVCFGGGVVLGGGGGGGFGFGGVGWFLVVGFLCGWGFVFGVWGGGSVWGGMFWSWGGGGVFWGCDWGGVVVVFCLWGVFCLVCDILFLGERHFCVAGGLVGVLFLGLFGWRGGVAVGVVFLPLRATTAKLSSRRPVLAATPTRRTNTQKPAPPRRKKSQPTPPAGESLEAGCGLQTRSSCSLRDLRVGIRFSKNGKATQRLTRSRRGETMNQNSREFRAKEGSTVRWTTFAVK